MEADRADDLNARKRTDFSQFVFDYYLFQHGLRNVAEMRVIDLIGSVRKYGQSSSRVRVFGRLCGMLAPFHLQDEEGFLSRDVNVKKERSRRSERGGRERKGRKGRKGREGALPAIEEGEKAKEAGGQMQQRGEDSEEEEEEEEEEDDDENDGGLFGAGGKRGKMAERERIGSLDVTADLTGEPKWKGKFSLLDEFNKIESTNLSETDSTDIGKYRDHVERNKLAIAAELNSYETSPYSFSDPLPSGAIDFTFYLLAIILEKGSALALPTLNTADEIWTICIIRAMECATQALKEMPAEATTKIKTKIQEICSTVCCLISNFLFFLPFCCDFIKSIENVDEILEHAILIYMENYNLVASKLSNILSFTTNRDKVMLLREVRSGMRGQPLFGGRGVGGKQIDFALAAQVTNAMLTNAILSYDEFRSLVRVVDPKLEERVLVRMFRDSLLLRNSTSVGPQAFLSVCRDCGVFGVAAGKLGIIVSIMKHTEEETRELQKMLMMLWRMTEPLFERRLLEVGARRRDIPIEAYGEMRNRIADVGKMVGNSKIPQKAVREFRTLAVDLAFFGGEGGFGDGCVGNQQKKE
ncbi:uncharacterized protein MONOS_2713 [Monocercomonoides exilis]|uniref:uncharacterized protein n=1 Tax=Monocercomonoides exilis TaxID=2049356 RepID=UPI00355A2602|nr:hypothetical protein MONOS_2713 [Monocercomonoides exilis]|eukprot:MONOS_2713.1-p1 / transcript=MONOS_2713.1 / gene=MONOS_2713 / organism=Monocercomonoides_exilis_PA203 / gene_product=unspecified product / transcript_product=unspecified product / location=Mono_scaffold00057:74933-76894(-) / protein_length=583 / sequence_SO=supercontig / SO=protein_coding / is_pseudo=false